MQPSEREPTKLIAPQFNIPYRGTAHFVGREQKLLDLHELLELGHRAAIAAVEGMGGAGKTELAIQYATRHQKDYPGGICWFGVRETNPAAQILAFAQSKLNLEVPQELAGRRLELEERVSWCWENWRPAEGLVLVVLDDLTDLADCLPFLPKPEQTRFRVLITSRLRDLDPGFIEQIPLDVLSPEEALQLLEALVGKERVEPEIEKAKELCAWLGRLPLALQLVGSYLTKKPHWSLAKMLERLEAQKLDSEALDLTDFRRNKVPPTVRAERSRSLPGAHSPSLPGGHIPRNKVPPTVRAERSRRRSLPGGHSLPGEHSLPGDHSPRRTLNTAERGVRAAFQLSWLELEPATQEVARLSSLLAGDIFLWQWIESAAEKLDWPDSVTEDAIDQLYERHLLQQPQPAQPAFKFHTLIRQFLQEKLPESDQASNFKKAVAATMAAVAREIPQVPTRQQIESLQIAIPHLEEVAQNLTDAIGDDDLTWPFVGLGRLYEGQGLYGLAEPWRQQCLSTTRDRLGSDHPGVATSLNNLAALYFSQGRYAEAEPLLQQALDLTKSLLGYDHPNVAISLNNLAGIYFYQGRYAEAETLYMQALKLTKKLLNFDQINVDLLRNMAVFYSCQGHHREAENLYMQALKLRKEMLYSDHFSMANSLQRAVLCSSQGRYGEAENLYMQALKLTKKTLFYGDNDVANSLNIMARLYKSQGRYAEAETLCLQVLYLRKKLLTDDHPQIAISLNNLAVLYAYQGRYAQAEPLYLQGLELTKKLLGSEHPDVANSLNNLAGLYYSQGRYAEAEPLYLQALELSARVLGPNHPLTVSIKENLAYLQSNVKASSSWLRRLVKKTRALVRRR